MSDLCRLFPSRCSSVAARSSARPTGPICGNGINEPGEQCDDGNQVDGDGCSAACRWEFCGDGVKQPNEECDDGNFVFGDGCGNCRLPRCGNGFREGVEQCDGSDLGGYMCTRLGADGGLLGCKPNCTFDLSGCQACGNGRREGTERCDGADVGGETCVSQGYPEGGVLGCQGDCFSFDTNTPMRGASSALCA